MKTKSDMILAPSLVGKIHIVNLNNNKNCEELFLER
jgi:hypothetical protein